jgi:manganese transport protein
LISRLVAIVPAAIAVAWAGQAGATRLLIVSQVILSLQLPFAVVPLIQFTSSRTLMGPFSTGPIVRMAAWGLAGLIILLNGGLVVGLLCGR